MLRTESAEQLRSKRCRPCEGGVEKLSVEEATQQLASVEGWRLAHDGQRIRKEWVVEDFMAAMEFFGRVAEVAEDEGHHPDLHLEGYRNVAVELWTHAIGGLSENDFIVAAKIDLLSVRRKQ